MERLQLGLDLGFALLIFRRNTYSGRFCSSRASWYGSPEFLGYFLAATAVGSAEPLPLPTAGLGLRASLHSVPSAGA